MFVYTLDDIIWLIAVAITAILFTIVVLMVIIDKMTEWIKKKVNGRQEDENSQR